MPLRDMAQLMRQHGGHFIASVHGANQPQMHAKIATRQGKRIDAAVADQEQFDIDRIKLAELKGFKALKFTVEMLRNSARVGLRDLPEAFRSERFDAGLVDQVTPAAAPSADVVPEPVTRSRHVLHFLP